MKIKLIVALMLVGLMAVFQPVMAEEEQKKNNPITIEEIIVTGTKIEKKIENLTDSVTIITAAEIEENSFTDFTEILRYTPGVEFKQAGGPGHFNYPKLRGFGQGHFLVVIDGVKVNEATSGGVSNLLGHIDPQIIEKIEILQAVRLAFSS